jgi:hypothetical protein
LAGQQTLGDRRGTDRPAPPSDGQAAVITHVIQADTDEIGERTGINVATPTASSTPG